MRRIHRVRSHRGVYSEAPATGRHYVIYAVVLREHPNRVKLGRTTNWRQRSKAYSEWNFAAGDGIGECAIYCVTEMYVDLAALEGACLAAMNKPLVAGNEWFRASLSDATATIERVLAEADLTFVRLDQTQPTPLLRVISNG